MRKVLSIAMMAAMLGLVGMTRDAGATITISLEWSGCGSGTGGCTATGGNTITVNPGGGQTLRLDVYLQHDIALPFGEESNTFSLDFDVSENVLNLGPMAATEWVGYDDDPTAGGVSLYGPFTSGLTVTESTGSNTGRINNYESASLGLNLPPSGLAYTVGTVTATAPARYRVGQAFFTVNGGANDGTGNIFSGIFAPGDKFIIGDGLGTIVPASDLVLGTATVVIPEPGTVSLLGLGLVGLILAGRRSRRS